MIISIFKYEKVEITIKGWNKIYLQTITLGTIMFFMSFVPEYEFVYDLIFDDDEIVNSRGLIYYFTLFFLFAITILRIICSYKPEDFKN